MAKRREIRNSTAEFLIFQIEGKEQGIEVFYKDKTVWCTQKAMSMLFDCSTDNVGLHLKNIFASGELEKDSVTEKISATASDGKNYMTQFYNLDAVISVGYRVNSIRATQFRQWATRDHKVRAVWDEERNHWWFSVLDIVGAINQQDDHEKNRNYWKYLKAKLRKENSEVVSGTTQLKLTAPDGKKRMTDVISQVGVDKLAKAIRNQQAMDFLDWFTYSDNTIDGQSRKKAYTLWESNLVADKDVGTVKALQQIHAYLFGGLYDFAGKIRTKTIVKGNTLFCMAEHLHSYLKTVEAMPETTFDEIVEKYVEMNAAHPFMEGNGRSTRIWLDMIFKKCMKMCVDWSKIDKKDYLDAMIASHTDSSRIHELLKGALTDKIDDREIFMKGIDYSYYYEQEE